MAAIERREDNFLDKSSDYDIRSSTVASPVPPSSAQHGVDAEVAKFFAQDPNQKPIHIDDATNIRLKRMIYKRVLVVMVVTYFLQTLDKGTINFASIMHIREDTHLKGQEYSWLTTCLYIAILVAEFPTNRLLQRLPIGKYLAFSVSAWGAVLACTAACHNFTGLVIVRTLLGVFECVCQPAFVLMSTIWFKREEQALIIGTWYAMNGFQQCVGGLLAYGVSHIHSNVIKSWQVLFLLLGCITFVWGIFIAWWLPDSPMRATCWSLEDRRLMMERVRDNETGVQNKTFKWYQAKEALMDPKVWAVTMISFTNALPTGGLGAFSNLILTDFGFSVLQTDLLAIAQGVIIMLFLFAAATLSKRFNQKTLFIILFTLPNIAGSIVFLTVPTRHNTRVGLLLAFYCCQGFGAVAILNLALMTNNTGGRTKQVMASSMIFVAWATGNAIGPQVFRTNDAPRYPKGFAVHLAMYGLQIAVAIFLRLYLIRQNALKRRNALGHTAKSETGQVEANIAGANGEIAGESVDHSRAFDDQTDRENPDFRYVY